jgi:hypothetical protein
VRTLDVTDEGFNSSVVEEEEEGLRRRGLRLWPGMMDHPSSVV